MNSQKFVRGDGSSFTLPVYSLTLSAVLSALKSSSGIRIDFDSAKADTSVPQNGGLDAAYQLVQSWQEPEAAGLDVQMAKLVESDIAVYGKIGAYATLPCGPGGWYNSAQLTRAFAAKDDPNVWNMGAAAGSWRDYFEQPNGSLARRVDQILVVSDYSITFRSHACCATDGQQRDMARAVGEVTPLFLPTAGKPRQHEPTHHDDDSLSVTYTLDKGRCRSGE